MHFEENPTTGIADSWAEPPAIADGSFCGAVARSDESQPT
jgi:hypothetical protein